MTQEATTPTKKVKDDTTIVVKLPTPITRQVDNIKMDSLDFLNPDELTGAQIADFFSKNPVDPKKPMDPKKQIAFLVFMCKSMMTPDDFDSMKAANLGACNKKLSHMRLFNDFFQEDGEL